LQSIIKIVAAWRSTVLNRVILYCAILLITLFVSGCISGHVQSNRHAGNGWYTVKPGDTLYSIAWRYGLDSKKLGRWNQLFDDDIIYLGQRLIMHNPGRKTATQLAAESASGNSSRLSTLEPSASSTQSLVVKKLSTTPPPAKWLWPVKGKLLNTFSINHLDRRGIDIAGTLGQTVQATAAGKVVYSGNGLVGYGNLIIIKHNETYLSAYAYCKERLVSEGSIVKAGTIIAKMGLDKNKLAKLHFEIRKNGKPVDPMNYLPNK
jgi:lipoprotein NlpD